MTATPVAVAICPSCFTDLAWCDACDRQGCPDCQQMSQAPDWQGDAFGHVMQHPGDDPCQRARECTEALCNGEIHFSGRRDPETGAYDETGPCPSARYR